MHQNLVNTFTELREILIFFSELVDYLNSFAPHLTAVLKNKTK